jgi:DNA-binding CsgD family transcriptional regulator
MAQPAAAGAATATHRKLRGVSPPELAALTEREREVLTLVAAGLSDDAIAARLYVSPLTAKTHVNRIMAKLGTRDRAQLVSSRTRPASPAPPRDYGSGRRFASPGAARGPLRSTNIIQQTSYDYANLCLPRGQAHPGPEDQG